jgi:hypothetical protein
MQQENPGRVETLPSTRVSELTVDMATMSAITKAELDQQITTAHAYPRSLTSFQRDCRSMATLTPEVAAECFYVLPARKGGDGKPIQGPSVRLAEIVVSAWGNCRAGSRVLEEGRDFIVAQGQFHDLERGTVISKEVRRRIVDSKGRRYSLDMISTTANAACSIAMRNAVFQGIPKALWASIYRECLAVVRGDAKTLVAKRAEIVDILVKMGASKQQLFDALDIKGTEDIGLDEVVTLTGWANAIRDGEAEFDDVFAPKDKPAAQVGNSRTDQAKAALSATTSVPQFDEATARAAISGAGSQAALDEVWKAIVADYAKRAIPLPIELEAARNDRREALNAER